MKKYILLSILLILTIPSVLALFHPGFFLSDDGEWMIIRFSAFHQALRDGQFPVRFLTRLNYGYGYPVANFLYPGFMYLAEIFKLLGFGFVNSIKIILGLSMISSAVFCYFWLSKLFKTVPALCGALFYLYAPYHLYDAYTRGSVGEVLALAIVPFVLWQVERKSVFWSSLGIGLLILSHNTLAVLFLPFIFLYFCLDIWIARANIKERNDLLKRYITTLLAGLGLSAFFWIPALFDLQYTIFSSTPVSDFSNYFANIKLIGFSTLSIFLVTLIFIFSKRIDIDKNRLTVLFFVVGFISLFFSGAFSAPFWNVLPVSFVQFPLRLLSVVIVSASFLLASVMAVSSKQIQIVLLSVIGLFIIISFKQYGTPIQFFDKGESFYATNEGTTTVKNEYMPVWVKNVPYAHPENIIEGAPEGISNVQTNSNKVDFNFVSTLGGNVTINRVYFPGWNTYVNNVQVSTGVEATGGGQMKVVLPKDNSMVSLEFGETPMRLFADVVSLTSFFILGVIAYNYKRKRQHV